MPDRQRVWPGNGQVYVINDFQTHTYPLNCQVGERICYGAWVQGGNLTPYWGAGRNARENCQSCCLTCPAARSAPFVLESRDAQTPVPSLTWRFDSYFSGMLEVAFYSADRTLKWPPGNQVFFIEGLKTQNIRLSCQAGQHICYGAWPRGNTTKYWGVGYGGRNGCVRCCYACDGGETQVIRLDP